MVPFSLKKAMNGLKWKKKLIPVPKPNRRKSKKSSPEIGRTNFGFYSSDVD
jgi:hypothetical protein